ITLSGLDSTYAVAEFHPIATFASLYRSIIDSKQDTIALAQRYNYRSRLHTRALFGHHEFSASEVFFGCGQQNRELDWEDVFAIEVLMEAVIIAGSVA